MSLTVMTRSSSTSASWTAGCVSPECFSALVRPSSTKRYAASSRLLGYLAPSTSGETSSEAPSGSLLIAERTASAKPVVGEGRRVDAAGEFAQVLMRLPDGVADLAQLLVHPWVGVVHLAARELDPRQQRDELLLRTVMQISLDASPLLGCGFGHPCP